MNDFFTVESFATLSGCVAAVVVIVNTTRSVFGWGPAWFALFVSILCSATACAIALVGASTPLGTSDIVIRLLIAVVNGCLIYTSAFGIQNKVIAKQDDEFHAQASESTDWRSPWR